MFQTFLILITMVGMLALLGFIIYGLNGAFLALFVCALLVLLYPSINPSILARLYGTKFLSQYQAPKLYKFSDQLSERAGLSHSPSIFLLNTDVMTAFTVGNRKNSAIILSTGLINRLEFPEIISVIAHETAHIINNDLWLMSLTDIISIVTAVLSVIGQIMVLFYLPFYFFMNVYVPWIGIIVLITAPLVNTLLQLTLSRVREFDADLTAVYLTGEKIHLANALKKIELGDRSFIEKVFFPTKREKIPSLFRTHPSAQERILKLDSVQIPKDIQPIIYNQPYNNENFTHTFLDSNLLIKYLLGHWF